MGIGLIDIEANDCIMLWAHQSLTGKELDLRNKSMADFYISVVKRYKKKLFFSNDISLSGDEVLAYYRIRFKIEFCYYDKYIVMRSKESPCSICAYNSTSYNITSHKDFA